MSKPDPSGRGSRVSWFRRPRVLIVAAAAVVVLAVGGVLGYGIVSAQARSDGGDPARADASTAESTVGATATPTAAPQHTPTPAPTTARPATPRPTASASPSDAPTFSVPPRPDTVLALDCNGLIDPAVRTEVLGDTGHLLDTGGPASEEGVAAERQSGVLRCDWFSSAETRSLSLYVLPDGLAAFRAFSASLGAYGSDQLGPDSRVTCDPTSPTSVWSCRGGFVASGHWVEYNFGGSQPAGTPAPFPLLSTVAASVSSALASAGPSRPTPMPAGAPQSWSSCAAFDTGSLQGTMQAPALQVPHADDWGLTLMEAAFRRADFNTCGWYAGSGLTNVTFSIVPGAGWAVRDVAAETAAYPTGVSTLVSVPGAQAAVRTCFAAYGDCTVRMSVNGTMLSAHTISLPGSGRTPEDDAMTAARYLVANLPG